MAEGVVGRLALSDHNSAVLGAGPGRSTRGPALCPGQLPSILRAASGETGEGSVTLQPVLLSGSHNTLRY